MSYLQKPDQLYDHSNENIPESIVRPNSLRNHHKKDSLTIPIGEILERYKHLPPQVFIFPGISQGAFGFVFGPPKSGKTTFVESLLMNIAAGQTSFLCNELPFTNKKCLFVSLEEGTKRQRFIRNGIQIDSFKEEQKQLIKVNFITPENNMPAFIYNEEQWKILRNTIAESGADIVAIDSLNRLTGDSNGEEEVAKYVTKKLQDLIREFNITLIVINHTTKSSCNEIQTHSSMRGSGLYGSEADFLIAVNRTASGSRYVKLVFSRHDKDDDEEVIEIGISKNRLIQFKRLVTEKSVFMDQDGRFDATNENIVFDAIQSIVNDKELKEFATSELNFLHEGDERKMSKKTFFNALDKLSERGRIQKSKKGFYMVKLQ